jgi:hypothetical protein
MKRIIEGLRYDTLTAEAVASWDNGRSYTDFRHCEENLYCTKNKEWFIHGKGGPLTEWRKPVGNMWAGGEDIKVLSAPEAQFWLEEKGFDDAVEEYFSDEILDA